MPDAVWIDKQGAQLTVEQLSEQAAEAIRGLNHLTRPGIGGLTYPAQVSQLAGDLCATLGRLPQLFSQLRLWLTIHQTADQLSVDSTSSLAVSDLVAGVVTNLGEASFCTQAALSALEDAHQDLSRIAANSPKES